MASLIFGAGALDRLGATAKELGFTSTLFVVDPGLHPTGIPERALAALRDSGITAHTYDRFGVNPDSAMVEEGRAFAAPLSIDSVVALGGGSALDAAKGINFLLTNGGRMREYRGYGKARKPLLPAIGVPTTAGTGSEAQSYCVIADAESHMKMACGDPSAMFRAAILDPDLTASAPKSVRAAAGLDAAAHAIETWVTRKRSPVSRILSGNAWHLIRPALIRAIEEPANAAVRVNMMLGSHLAGCAIEASMLGAAHACANPLTAKYGTAHGVALGILVPHVVRWNAETIAREYDEVGGADVVAALFEEAARTAGFPSSLSAIGAKEEDIPELAALAATQWTGTFNPRALGEQGAAEIYRRAI